MIKNDYNTLILKSIATAFLVLLLMALFHCMGVQNGSYSGVGGASDLVGIDYNLPRFFGGPIKEDRGDQKGEKFSTPDFETSLRPMGSLNRKNRILYPEDAPSYIIPDNEVVRWYAENTILTDTALIWKHNKSAVRFNYWTDDDLFNNPQDNDVWQNPDYYLTHDNKGDCEDFSLAFASIIEAKGIPAEIIGVRLINNQYHWIVRFEFNGHTRFADINRDEVVIFQDHDPKIDAEWVAIGRNSIRVLRS